MCLLSWKRLMQSCCGHPQNFKVISKFSQIRPVFPDYLSVSYDYALTNQDYDFFNHPGSYRNIMQFQMTYLRRLFCIISICKFGRFKNPFAAITSLSELSFRIRTFILLVQSKKVISMNYGNSTSSWKPWRWVRLELIFSMKDICITCNLNRST